jgi:hypothetical protein
MRADLGTGGEYGYPIESFESLGVLRKLSSSLLGALAYLAWFAKYRAGNEVLYPTSGLARNGSAMITCPKVNGC